MAVDLKSPEGKEVLAGLLQDADVLVENFRPGVLDRLGFGHELIKTAYPHLIYTTVSGFGHTDLYDSPCGNRPAYAIITESMAGLTHLAGDGKGPPAWMGFAMADIFAGTLAFAGTLLELLSRADGREGGRVDIAMYDGALLMNDLAIAAYSAVGEIMGGGQYLLQSPWGPFETTDGYIVIAVLTEREWTSLCEAIGRPDLRADKRLGTGRGRSKHHQDLVAPAIQEWCDGQTKHDCTDALTAHGVAASPVNTAADVMKCPQATSRGMLVEVDDRVAGRVTVPGNPIKLGGPAGRTIARIPALGEHTIEVLSDVLGLPDERVQAMWREGVVAAPGEPAPSGSFGPS